MNHVIEFQKANGLFPDGKLGKKTALKMQEVFKIKSIAQVAHFLGQISHETGGFALDSENLNYSSSRLAQVFPKYFPTASLANQYANKPEQIANRVYANRMGNGPENSGDGWKYRGRGALQLTGKDNYKSFGKYLGFEIYKVPELAQTTYFWQTALFYFEKNKLWLTAANVGIENIRQITKAINGGYNGLDDRIAKTNEYFKIITA